MNELPDHTLAHEQVRGDEEAAGNGLEADDHRAVAEHGGAGAPAGDVRRLRIAENALPAAHHRRPPVKRSPAGVDAGDRTVPRPDLLHGGKVARREGPVEGLVREQDGIMIHGSGPGRAARPNWGDRWDSNPQPPGPQPGALTN